jgi:hypothetical protein
MDGIARWKLRSDLGECASGKALLGEARPLEATPRHPTAEQLAAAPATHGHRLPVQLACERSKRSIPEQDLAVSVYDHHPVREAF